MNQTRKNSKKPNFGLILACLAQIWAPKTFFREFYLYKMLDIIASYHCMPFQGKLIILTQENGKRPHFGPDLESYRPKFGLPIFLKKSG